jgi:integrase
MKNHRHIWVEDGDYNVCSICNKKILKLTPKNKDILIGKKSNGQNYTVRQDRHRYFFPEEWINFINKITNKKHRFLFIFALLTGGRIMEILNIRYKDIDMDRGTISFTVTKQRVANKGYSSIGKVRSFFVSSNLIKEYKSFIRGKTINPNDYIFLDNKKLPENYELLTNEEKEKYFISSKVNFHNIFKRKLKESNIEDYYNFSLHNIRKTYGQVMRAFEFPIIEICYRMGDTLETSRNHYGSAMIYTSEEIRKWKNIFGELK